MRLVVCLVAILAVAGTSGAVAAGLGPDGGTASGGLVPTVGGQHPSQAAQGTMRQVGEAADGAAPGRVAVPAVSGVAGDGQAVSDAIPPVLRLPEVHVGPLPLGLAVDTGAAGDTPADEPAPTHGTPPAGAAPIAAVGGAAAAWHLRFLPWRRLAHLGGRLATLVGAAPLLGLFSRIDDDTLKEHPVRARILAVLEERPGACMQEIQEATDVAWGTVVYHLGRLSKARHVVSLKDGRAHRFWVEADPEARVRDVASVLKQPTPAQIAAAVRAEPGIHQGALCQRLDILPATASKYLKRLAESGLVSVQAQAQRRRYYPTPSLEALHVPAT